MARVTCTLRICDDCLVAVANGDLPEDAERAAAVMSGLAAYAPGHVVPAGVGDEGCILSRSRCDCCGVRGFGPRHEAAVLMDG